MGGPLVLGLVDAGDADRALVGGKAGTLGILAAAGFPVPAGFVVTAAGGIDDEVSTAVAAALDGFGSGPFAVRSSAAAEDLPGASYAGLYETYLDVHPAGVMDAIKHCVASAGSERVRSYRAVRDGTASGGDHGPAEMAVLVQQMVDAAAAGVAFTANPVTGDRDQVLVTAARGLGEALVSGGATGEQWTVTSDTRPELTRADPAGSVLTGSQVRGIAELATGVAHRCDDPQDIEWAIDHSGRLWLLQARPMTALPDPVQWDPPGPGLWARNFRLGEWLAEAMTPLFADWAVPRIETGYLDGMRSTAGIVVPFRYATVNGWYFNATPMLTPGLFFKVLGVGRAHAVWFLFNALARVSRDPAAADRAVLGTLENRWRTELLPRYHRLVAEGEADVDSANPRRLVEIIDQIAGVAGEYLWYLAIVGGSAWKMEKALTAFCRKHIAAGPADEVLGRDPQVLLRGLPGAEPATPRHAVQTIDWYQPTAGELPIQITNGTGGRHDGRHARLAATRIDTERLCRATLARHRRRLTAFDAMLAMVQRCAVIREEQARDLTLGWPLLRRCLHRLGAHLQTAGVITDIDDVYFLTRNEVTASFTEKAAKDVDVRARRVDWNTQRRLTAPLTLGTPPRLIGDPIARAVQAARTGHIPDGAIVGHPASAGRATGPVRIVTGPADFDQFADGDVLVAKTTAPAWTPLFGHAAAIVTDGGTLAAHASLVAREFGIPAVVGAGDATTRLRTGQYVTVDGNTGTVLPLLQTSHGEPPTRQSFRTRRV